MNNLASFFGKILKKISDDEKVKMTIISVLSEKTNSNLEKDSLIIKDGVVTISAHPAVKQEILLHKKDILSEIGKKVDISITDLR